MIYVGINVAKDKHDCFITNSDGEVLFKPFTISNNRNGFETLFLYQPMLLLSSISFSYGKILNYIVPEASRRASNLVQYN